MARSTSSRPLAAGLLAAGLLAVVLVAGCGSAATPSPTPSAPPSAPPSLEPSASAAASEEVSASPSAAVGKIYVVKKGDTLYAIARANGITLAALRAANPEVADPTKLRIGQKLVIPAP
jgi:lipoprotein NlpD